MSTSARTFATVTDYLAATDAPMTEWAAAYEAVDLAAPDDAEVPADQYPPMPLLTVYVGEAVTARRCLSERVFHPGTIVVVWTIDGAEDRLIIEAAGHAATIPVSDVAVIESGTVALLALTDDRTVVLTDSISHPHGTGGAWDLARVTWDARDLMPAIVGLDVIHVGRDLLPRDGAALGDAHRTRVDTLAAR